LDHQVGYCTSRQLHKHVSDKGRAVFNGLIKRSRARAENRRLDHQVGYCTSRQLHKHVSDKGRAVFNGLIKRS
ncbi:hypothetical protein CKJ90_32390, partial [Klebsiella pneumoniae]